MQVTDACAPHITASPLYTCRRHKRNFDHLGHRRPTAHPVRMVEAVELVACHVFNLAEQTRTAPHLRRRRALPGPAGRASRRLRLWPLCAGAQGNSAPRLRDRLGVATAGARNLECAHCADSCGAARRRAQFGALQTRGATAADHGIEDERHARLQALSRSVGTADGVRVTGRCRLFVDCAVSHGASWPGQRTSRTLLGVCKLHGQTTGSDHHADRRAQHGPRRAPRAA